jgi:hypothetical protein
VGRLRWLVGIAAFGWLFANCAQSGTILECDPGKEACEAICVDLKSDQENCGSCGKACGGAQVCVAGMCATQCPNNEIACASGGSTSCVNAKSDNANCGMCGKACKPGEVCSGGVCSTSCQGVAMCGQDGGQAYCADLKTDNANCGKCGKACNATEACVAGTCTGSCTMTQTLCGGDAGKPYCALLDSDNANCGACGKTCGLLETCTAGVCEPGCAPFQKLCTPDGGAPYCADTLSDNVNCGTCGTVCPQNKPVCSGGACQDGTIFLSCLQVHQQQPNSPSGTYPIDPDGGGGAGSFNAFCDMVSDGGGWTLLSWAADANNSPYGPPYPGYAQCPALNCARGSGVPINQLNALIAAAKSFGKGQSATANIKATFDVLNGYQYAGKYVYPTLSGFQVSYSANVTCTGFQTGTYTNIVNAPSSGSVYLSQSFAYSNHNDFSNDNAGTTIWDIGVPTNYCDGSGAMPGTWMGNWTSTGQYGPGVASSAGSSAIYVR